jgi:Tfp pilus assembly protein PilX
MDMEQLMPLVMALLGMAGLRTFEKSKKITK